MQVVEIEEEESAQVHASLLDQATALGLHRQHGDQIRIEFPGPLNPHHYILRSRGHVGQIRVGKELLLHIRPKVAVSDLFAMLEYAYQLTSFRLFDQGAQCETIPQVFEHLAGVLARRVLARSRVGLLRDYVEQEESLPYVRGRLLPWQRAGRDDVLRCRYQEHTADLVDNRILAWTLHGLRRFSLERESVRQLVHQAFRRVVGAVGLGYVAPAECIGRFYHRLNQDYRPMHALCRFFLEHTGPALGVGEREFIPFLLYMPVLFESFVAEWLKVHLGSPFAVKPQWRTPLRGSDRLAFQIDLVLSEVRSGAVLAVLDTKYKREEEPEGADIQQVVAYAVQTGAPRAFLVYPSALAKKMVLQVGEIQVRTIIFDLSKDLEIAGELFLHELLQSIQKN